MKKRLLIGIVVLFTLSLTIQAQTFTGSYQLVGVKVIYTDVARPIDSLEDSVASYTLEAHWPSVAGSMFSAELMKWEEGDTITVIETPDILLSPTGLGLYGINLSVALDQDAGQMLIPGVEGDNPTYPTLDTENCSTFAVIAPSPDNGLIEYTTTDNSYDATEGTFTWGFGISESDVFDWFDAPADWEDPTAGTITNWGVLMGTFNDDDSGFETLDITWHATDGLDADAGLDPDDKMNRHLGVTMVPGDTVTTGVLASMGAPVNVGTYPILGGEGIDLDADGEPDGVVDTDWGYYFDPSGPDGILGWAQPGADDSPFQFTGYYMTYNFLSAVGLFETVFAAVFTGAPENLGPSFIFAPDPTLRTFGAPAAFSGAVTTALADSLTGWITAGVLAYMAGGMSQAEATLLATEDALQAGMLQGIGGAMLLDAAVTDLFFTEYAEGSSNNKYVEIYNGTGADVDLSSYSVQGTNNGTAWGDGGDRNVVLSGTLASGDVYILAADQADSASILALADTALSYESPMHHNGDDGIALLKDGTIIDVIGVELIDPGTAWDVAGVVEATKDHTLVRKSTVRGGNTDWTASAGTDSASSEWLVLDKDTWTELGQHTFTSWTFPDDSDHDFNGTNGRMVFQIGNSCVPDMQTRDVFAHFDVILSDPVSVESEDILPLKFAVRENYPNPFNPVTKISFDLPEFSPTKVTVWNMLGQKVATLYAGDLSAGSHTITFDARNQNGEMLPSGIYIYRVEAGSKVATKKMMLLK